MSKVVCKAYMIMMILISASFSLAKVGGNQNSQIERHNTYVELSRQVFARQEDSDSAKLHVSEPEKVTQIRSQLHELISEEVRAALEVTNPSADVVASAVTALQGEFSFSDGGADSTNTPFAKLFQLGGNQDLAVAYVILQGGDAIPDTQPYLEFYDRSNGSWELKAEAPTQSDFEGHTYSVAPMDSPTPSEAWFLAWGFPIGNPGTPLDVRLYAFDGINVRTVSKLDDLTGGQITVSRKSITLEYDREYKSLDPNNRVHETLEVTPNGLQ